MADTDDDFDGADEDSGDDSEVVVPAPREQTALIGHEAAEVTLLQAFQANRLPHGS